jgi:hypothetical protein
MICSARRFTASFRLSGAFALDLSSRINSARQAATLAAAGASSLAAISSRIRFGDSLRGFDA